MSRRYITATEENQIIERANRLCEYCRYSMDYSAQPFVIDHIVPIAEGGTTAMENLAFACGGCNGHKYTNTSPSNARLTTTNIGRNLNIAIECNFHYVL